MQDKPWFFKIHIIITVFLSVTAILMSGLLFLLLPQVSEILTVAQWRAWSAKSFGLRMDLEYSGWLDTVENGVSHRRQESVKLQTVGRVARAIGEADNGQQSHQFNLTFIPKSSETQSSYGATGEIRKLGDAGFIRFDNLPERVGSLTLDRYINRWLRLNYGGLLNQIDMPLIGGGYKLTREETIALMNEIRTTPFLTVKNRLKDETVNDIKTHHYEVVPEILFIKDFYMAYETLRRDREPTSVERQAIDRFFSGISPESGELWVGCRDYYPYRLLLRFGYKDGSRDGRLIVDLKFFDYNSAVTVVGPEGDVLDIMEITRSLLPSIVNNLPLARFGKGQTISGLTNQETQDELVSISNHDSDHDGLSDDLEFFYGSDPNNPDTDFDGMNDGDEVASGRNPIGSGGLFDFGVEAMLERNSQKDKDKSDQE